MLARASCHHVPPRFDTRSNDTIATSSC
jgi:hypothetical protein